jgi:hypothetical protein
MIGERAKGGTEKMNPAEQSQALNIFVSDSLRLTDDDILRRRISPEDHFVERKSFGDWKKDALKTVVAFANSLPIGQPGYLFIGVRDNGEVERAEPNLDKIQKSFADELSAVYPRIPYTAKALSENGSSYLVIIVTGSENRPHFAGPSYIREGSQTKAASEEQYRILISDRQGKVRELRQWIGKAVTLETIRARNAPLGPNRAHAFAVLTDCNQFYVTLGGPDFKRSIPMERVGISWDHNRNHLKLEYEE